MEDRDHKKLGKELELFTIDETVGKGLPMLLPKGATIRRELERFIVDEELKRGYEHVYTPDIARLELYKKSGHYPHYKDSMYAPIVIDEDEFMLRPMTCPHHFQMYLSRPHSYRELPIRLAEVAKLYRYEQSGELMGLQRVRSFCLSDAHIICSSEEQAVEEMGKALDLIEYANGVLGLKMGEDYRYRLSMGDRDNTEKYYKDDAGWDKAEGLLRELMKSRGFEFEEAKDEAAFYGPKIDIQMKNANGKEDTAFTVQYDLSSPVKFDLSYVGEDGKNHRCFVVHRSSIGSIERIMAFLIEKYAGAFPLWLAPVHVKILPIGESHTEYATIVYDRLKSEGMRVELDDSNETLGKKIANFKKEKVPYALVIGDKEVSSNAVTVESRDNGNMGAQDVDTFLGELHLEIKNRA
jgi:threonyl-tRNA synthetase